MSNITSMVLTTPDDMVSTNVDNILEKFEKKFQDEVDDKDEYYIIISGEYSRRKLDMVEEAYRDAGWIDVVCRTSSENGERAGLTALKVSSK